MSRRLYSAARCLAIVILPALLGACGTSASVRDLASRAVSNEEVLGRQSKELTDSLRTAQEQQSGSRQQVAQHLNQACRETLALQRELLLTKAQLTLTRQVAEYDRQAWVLQTSGFESVYNLHYAPQVIAAGEAKRAELAAARKRQAQFPDDTVLRDKVNRLQRQVISISAKSLQHEAELREKLAERLAEGRTQIQRQVQTEIDAIQRHIDAMDTNCDGIKVDEDADRTVREGLQREADGLARLHDQQRAALATLKDYTERKGILPLVVAGAGNAVQQQVTGVRNLLLGKAADFAGQIDSQTSTLAQRLASQAGLVDDLSNNAEDRLGQVIESWLNDIRRGMPAAGNK